MNRKSTLLIIIMSLGLVLITSLTFMLSNANGTNSLQQGKEDKILSQVPSEEESKPETIEPPVVEEIEKEVEVEEPDTTKEDLEIKQVTEEVTKPEAEVKSDAEEPTTGDAKATTETTKEVKKEQEDKFLNKQTKNTNILCLGVADKELEMISIYSINKSNKKSAGIFLPTRTSLKVNGELLSLREIYQQYGIINLKKILSQCLEVDIPYHMVADKQGLVELSELIGPLYVENENIDIPNLFVRPVSGKDDEILQSLAEKITQPKMVLQVPKLIKIFIANVQSDIGISGLWDLYSVFKNLNHSELSKIVLWGEKMELTDKTYWFITPYDWHNVVYEMTR